MSQASHWEICEEEEEESKTSKSCSELPEELIWEGDLGCIVDYLKNHRETLTSLDLSRHRMDCFASRDWYRFMDVLASMKSLVCLDLSQTCLHEGAAMSLFPRLPPTLQVLKLSRNMIGNHGVKELVRAFHFQRVRELQNGSPPHDLRVLDLGKNSLDTEGAVKLTTWLAQDWCKLQELRLDNNFIGNNAVAAIAKGLATNRTLKTLRLHCNPGGLNMHLFLTHTFPANTTLTHLTLDALAHRNPQRTLQKRHIEYWLLMNLCGRHLMSVMDNGVPLWPNILAKGGQDNISLVYTFLRERPDLAMLANAANVQH